MKRSSLFVSIILCLALLLSLGATGVFAAEEGQEAAFVKNWGMTLNDEIVLKFEMGEIPAGATEIKATVGGRTYTAPASQQIISVPVYATQMTEAVTLTAVDGSGESVVSRSFTVLAYLQSVLDNALFASYHPLVKELLNYGSAAQLHFIGSSDITVSGAGQTAVPGNASAYAIDDQSDLMDCTGASLVYREKIALRFYFDIDPTGCTFTVNGEAAALTVNEAGKYVEIADILPQNLDQQVVLSVTDAEGRAVSVTYSPLTYIVRMSQKGSDTTKALVKALYNYHLAAKAFVPLQDFVVSFNVGHDGESFEDRTIAVGDPYGQLPTPADRVGYTFGGWYLNAECTGEAVTAETLVTSSHTLYAKWGIEPDTNPVVLEDNVNYNPYNAKLAHDFVDGKHVYTYTTKGVASPTTEPWGRRLNVYGWESGTQYVAIEFRYTEAFKADGVTPIEKIGLGVYTGTSGVGSPKIYDATGKLVASGNAISGLAVGQWYTVIVEPGSLTGFSLWTCHGYTADAAVITMEIRDRGTYAVPGNLETAWGDFPEPTLHFADGKFQYDLIGSGASVPGEHRQLNLTLSTDGMTHVMYEVMVENPTGGASATITSGNTVFYDLETGMKVTSFEEGKWYGATYTTGKNLGTSMLNLGYTGSDGSATGGIDVHIRNLRAFAADTNTAAAIATETYWGTLYRTGASTYRWATTNAVSGGSEAALYQRAIKFTNPLATTAVMKVDFRFLYCTDSSGNNVAPNMWSDVTGGKFVVVDPENGEVMGSLEVGKTYSMYMTLDASASANMQVCYGAAAGLRAGLEIVSSEAIAISASSVTMTPNSVTYGNVGLYQYNGEWAYGYSRYDGIHSEAAGNADYRKIVVNLDGTAYTTLSFKFLYDEATNNGNKVTPIMFCTGYSALTSQVTDADGNTVAIADMVAGQWYNVTVAMADGSALKDLRFFPAGQGNAASGTANVNIRLRFKDFTAQEYEPEEPAEYQVTFDLNYDGATDAPATITVAEGSAYGELPTPTRAQTRTTTSGGYTFYYGFAGWYTNAECTGEPVKPTDVADQSRTLYAKWDKAGLMPRAANSVYSDPTLQYIDNEWVYVYANNGTARSAIEQERLNLHLPEKIAYAVSYKVMLRNETDAAMFYYDAGNLGVDIYDANGILLYKRNYRNGGTTTQVTLEEGKWYTVVHSNRDSSSHYLAGFDYFGVGGFSDGAGGATMYVKDIEIATENVPSTAGVDVYTNNINLYPNRNLRVIDGEWAWVFAGNQAQTTQSGRFLRFNIKTGPVSKVTFKLMADNCTGDVVFNYAQVGSAAVTFKDPDGNTVDWDKLQTGVWYDCVFTRATAMAAAADWSIGYFGTGTGGMDIYFKDIQLVPAE